MKKNKIAEIGSVMNTEYHGIRNQFMSSNPGPSV